MHVFGSKNSPLNRSKKKNEDEKKTHTDKLKAKIKRKKTPPTNSPGIHLHRIHITLQTSN